MTEKEIITEFVNSDSFPIIHNYISRPYEETINEMQQDKDNLIKYLEEKISLLKQQRPDKTMSQEDIANFNILINYALAIYQDNLERIKNNNYESK